MVLDRQAARGRRHDSRTGALQREREDVRGDKDDGHPPRAHAERPSIGTAGEHGFEEPAEDNVAARGDQDRSEDYHGEWDDEKVPANRAC